MKQNVITILRWIGVLPCALLASIFMYAILYYSQHWYFDDSTLYGDYIVPCQASFASGIGYTYYGTAVAPFYKKQTAIGLVILVLLITGAGIFVCIVQRSWLSLAKDILCGAGACLGYGVYAYED